MHRIIACVAILLSVLILTSYKISKPSTIEVTYRDLIPEARKQVDCLAENIYFEARSEPKDGQKAVALVTMNRVQSKMFPKTVCGVVKERDSKICQFSWWCETPHKAMSVLGLVDKDEQYHEIKTIALDVYLNHEHYKDITKGALFYHADYVSKHKIGVKNLKPTTKIGHHIFYKVDYDKS